MEKPEPEPNQEPEPEPEPEPEQEPSLKRFKNHPTFKPMEISPFQTLGSKGMIRKREFIRVIIQALYSLGYQNAAKLLEEESGTIHLSPEIKLLQSQILDGNWDGSIETLNKIQDLVTQTRKTVSFFIFQQRFLECLNSGDGGSALWVLREKISPLGLYPERVHELASYLVSTAVFEESELMNKENRIEEMRRDLVMDLEKMIPPPVMVLPRRLEHLVETALTHFRNSCVYHNSPINSICLYWDHHCGLEQIPTNTFQILENHQNEVWFVQFSNNGHYLASSSSDCTAIIWTVSIEGIVSLKHTLEGHKKPVSVVAWSPDDTMLLTCGNAEVLRLWDVETGTCKHTFDADGLGVSSCAWFPDSKKLVCGSFDKCIYTWDLEGNELGVWRGSRMPKISDLSVTSDGAHLISVCADKDIRIHNFSTQTEATISEEQAITSVSVSRDGKFLIANLNSQEIHMWDVPRTWEAPIRYRGHKQGQYVIRSCFGGLNYQFIASGSEDSQVYIWHRQTAQLIAVLPGHSSTVNCVSWNPANPYLLASASDDRTIRIWKSTCHLCECCRYTWMGLD